MYYAHLASHEMLRAYTRGTTVTAADQSDARRGDAFVAETAYHAPRAGRSRGRAASHIAGTIVPRFYTTGGRPRRARVHITSSGIFSRLRAYYYSGAGEYQTGVISAQQSTEFRRADFCLMPISGARAQWPISRSGALHFQTTQHTTDITFYHAAGADDLIFEAFRASFYSDMRHFFSILRQASAATTVTICRGMSATRDERRQVSHRRRGFIERDSRFSISA